MIISKQHPRFQSLAVRERLTEAVREGIMVPQGLIAHGRGEAFDYLMGERTTRPAANATRAATALLLTARRPVISVNGNCAALAGDDIVRLSRLLRAGIEVNLFHRSIQRERRVARFLTRLGATDVLGVNETGNVIIQGIASPRRVTDPRGISSADVVLVPLEDGDRAEALVKASKKVIAIDLNPLSRTSRVASISIVDNIIRVIPHLIRSTTIMKNTSTRQLEAIAQKFDNRKNLATTMNEMIRYMTGFARN